MNYEHIPEGLKQSGRFCVWAYQNRKGKKTKVPYTPGTGAKARADDAGTFRGFDEACAAWESHRGRYYGIGLGLFDDLVGIDIDHCISESGEVSPVALDFLQSIGSYAERSPSGEGIHIILRASGFRYDGERFLFKNTKIGVEIYPAGQTSRYLTMTGDRLNEEDVTDCSAELETLALRYMPRGGREAPELPTVEDTTDAFDDAELMSRMRRSAKWPQIKALLDGELGQRYGSQSEADLALCNHLAFFTQRNAAQMDRVFRSSGLMREKWDEQRGADTYGAHTINRAVTDCKVVWSPGYTAPAPDDVQRAIEFLQSVDAVQNPRYSRDDIGAGYLLADFLKPFARPVADEGTERWLVYDGMRWTENGGEAYVAEAAKSIGRALAQYAGTVLENRAAELVKWAHKWLSHSSRKTYIREAATVYPVARSELDLDKWRLNLNNGTLDLRSMELKEHNPDDLITQLAPVDYSPGVRCDRWEKFVHEVMEPGTEETVQDRERARSDKAAFLQRWLGYCLCGDTSAEAFLILYGPTSRNGKSVCIKAVSGVLGDYAKTMNAESIMQAKQKNGRGPSEDIARIAGARMVGVGELPQGGILDAALVKLLTGGDTLTARRLYQGSFEFSPQCKFMLHTNHLPQCSDLSVFDSKRIMVLPFSRHFDEHEQDRSLKEIFRNPEAQSGILNWMLDGLRDYRQHGFATPASVLEAVNVYREDNDKTSRFIRDALISEYEGELTVTETYGAYKAWCRDNGVYAENSRAFVRNLEKKGLHLDRKRPRKGGNPTTLILGYQLTHEYELGWAS